MSSATPRFGVYLHIPFCAARCDYCAFAAWADRGRLVPEYLAACHADLERLRREGLPPASTVFVGGGTPSLVPAAELVALLGRIERAPGAEVTVECNPDDVTPALVEAYLSGGVTRVSLGVQSSASHVLAALGRAHGRADVEQAVALVRDGGFETFNLDLIYGAAGESLADWSGTLDDALALDPPHISAYALTVEAGTPLASDPGRRPDDDDQADKYMVAADRLESAGLGCYEVSNWARAGHECRHNLLYWTMGEYQGIGCAAHSHRGGQRFWNLRTPERYIAALAAQRSPVAGGERLDGPARALEALQLAIRTRDGVPAEALEGAAAGELGGGALGGLDDAALVGLVERVGERVVLTRRGRLLANEVALRLRAPIAAGSTRSRRDTWSRRDDEILPRQQEVGVAGAEAVSVGLDQ